MQAGRSYTSGTAGRPKGCQHSGSVQAADGYFRILGRVDDVINVAGHRLGTKELESAAIMVGEVAEAAGCR